MKDKLSLIDELFLHKAPEIVLLDGYTILDLNNYSAVIVQWKVNCIH